MLRFIIGGTSGLRAMHPAWWRLCLVGAVFAIAAALLVPFAPPQLQEHVDLYFVLVCGAYGLLFLVPFAHVALEKIFRKADSHAV